MWCVHRLIPNKSVLIPKVPNFLTFSLVSHQLSFTFTIFTVQKAARWSGFKPPPCFSVLVQGFNNSDASKHQAMRPVKSIYTQQAVLFLRCTEGKEEPFSMHIQKWLQYDLQSTATSQKQGD